MITITHEILQRVCAAHHLGVVESVVQPPRGINNPVFIINDRYALRFDGLQHEGHSRFYGEQTAYQHLRTHNIPAPEVIAVDTSKTLAPYDYMVMSKIEGQAIIDSWKDLTAAQRYYVAYHAGHYLARLHAITFSGHGQLRLPEEQRFPSWYAYVMDYLGRYGQEGMVRGIFTPATRDKILTIFQQHQTLLESAAPARLVHWDYHFENILQRDGHITGIIDFEWSLCGDPMYDFKVREQWEETCPGSRRAVYQGYADHTPLPDDHELRVALYCVMMYVDYAVDARNQGETDYALAKLLPLLDTFAV